MSHSSQSIRKQTLWLIVVVNLSLVILSSILWYALESYTELDLLTELAIAITAMSVLALIFGIIQERTISQPLRMVQRALNHVRAQGSQTEKPPNPAELTYGRQIVEEIAGHIYDMASQSTISKQEGETNDHMRSILDKMNAGVVAINKSGKVDYANHLASEILVPTEGALSGSLLAQSSDIIFQDGSQYQLWLDDCRQNKTTHQQYWTRVSNTQPDGTQKLFDLAAYYSKADSNDVEVILVMVDRTAEYTADEAQMDFVALAAHELRGPITVVRGYLDVLRSEQTDTTPPEHRKLIERMRVSSNQLSNYIHTILNVAKAEQGTMKIHPRSSQWPQIVTKASHDLNIRATAMNRKISFTFAENIPPVAVDEGSISQVITNILDNAIKYSEDGGQIEVNVQVKSDVVETTITDHGIGIPEAVVGNLFNKFYRSHRSRQGVSGTGLGLFLAKSVVEAHGGTIWVQSKENEGATFGFTVPVFTDELEKELATKGTDALIERKGHGWIKNHSKVIK